MKKITFYDGYWYCYSNSVAMLLSSIGENISPHLIEALTGVGLGAFYSDNSKLTFFSGATAEPDSGISKALEILGFEFSEQGNFDKPPFLELEQLLNVSPAVIGPLDMFYLNYNPNRPKSKGVDHYILVYAIEGNKVYLKDPAGYANVFIYKDDLQKAWEASEISYKRGSYRFWGKPKRITNPNSSELYKGAIQWYKNLYRSAENKILQGKIVNEHTFFNLITDLENSHLQKYQIDFLTNFSLPLAVKRSLDISDFVSKHNHRLGTIKDKQAITFGECLSNLMLGDMVATITNLKELAELELEQKKNILAS